ncbi:uncharacterized protein LOC111871142 isoform X3 [Cryptotermes secundus]|uniref:uncharacterized protein LOC111871142 isoform X3 n=1 Tax=Cryptotermes secundus TaxID=105785 RepID=UPI000CD7B89E|nr:uncharacterized protein LOC111871142 isoform X3 [Cryptotermes secundus]
MCRSRVTSWLRLYVSLVLGMAGALTEGNRTACHYQENDVTKPCELFHKIGCQNISYSPRTCEGRCELSKMNGQPYFYLTISTLFGREGFLGVKGTDDCWKFKVGNTSDHEKHVIMDLTFFPETSLKNVRIYRDGGRCDYLYSRSFLREPSDTRHADAPTQWQRIHQPWPRSPTLQKVLLLYSRDCPQFCEVARALGQLLQSFGNLKVLDPLQQNEMEQVSENISGWLTQHLQSPDVKLVIVVSEGAMVRQNALLNNQLVHNDEPHFLDPVFTLALQQMHERPQLGNDYKRIFPVRCNSAAEAGYEDIRRICPQEVSQLESAIRDMKSYCDDNPHYLKDHFSVVSR